MGRSWTVVLLVTCCSFGSYPIWRLLLIASTEYTVSTLANQDIFQALNFQNVGVKNPSKNHKNLGFFERNFIKEPSQKKPMDFGVIPPASISAANSCAPKGSAILRTWARKKHDPQTDWGFHSLENWSFRWWLNQPILKNMRVSQIGAFPQGSPSDMLPPSLFYHVLFWFRVVGRFHLDSTQVCCNKSSRFLIRIWLFKRDDPKKAALLTIKNTRKCIVFRTSNNHNECMGDVLRSCFWSLRTSP